MGEIEMMTTLGLTDLNYFVICHVVQFLTSVFQALC